jgi:hypothetical protein
MMRLACALAVTVATVVACSSSPAATVPPQPNGASCTSRAECQSNACVAAVCAAGTPLDAACTSDEDCPDGNCLPGPSGGSICQLACPKVGVTGCNHVADTAWVCDGTLFHPFGACGSCNAGAGGIAQTFVTCGDTVLKLADPQAPCTDANDGACSLDHALVLSCDQGYWKTVDTCTSPTPYCGHLATGVGTCPATAKYGCAGCGM